MNIMDIEVRVSKRRLYKDLLLVKIYIYNNIMSKMVYSLY